MKTDDLLNDVLTEAAPEEFQNAVLRNTLRHVRRRRHLRVAKRVALTVALAAVVPALLWRSAVRDPSVVTVAGIPGVTVVRTQPLDSSLTVSTDPGSVEVVTTSSTSLGVVETGLAADSYRVVTDEELLLFCAGRPSAIVRHKLGEAELVFVDPRDWQGFPVQ